MVTYSALVLIVDNPGLSQSQLAAAMDIERPNLVVIVDELEQRGLITRERVPTDRRLYALKATITGRRLCEKALAANAANEARLFAGLEENQRAVLHEALRSVRNTHET
jgi:DNA-binding MarR family transcriptional regulator